MRVRPASRSLSLLIGLGLGLPLLLGATLARAESLLSLSDLQYAGAFRLPAGDFGVSSLNFSQGVIAVDPTQSFLYIVGHAHHQALAEFAIPGFSLASELTDLPMAEPPIQDFVTILDRLPDGNPDALDRIGGLLWVPTAEGAELWVNAFEYYDAPTDNVFTTLLLDDPSDLAGSALRGSHAFAGGAGHTSGWMSPVPTAWQDALGGTHLTGQSSGQPIISRFSVGPSAFAFTPIDPGTSGATIPTERLLDFSLDNPLHDDLSNDSLENSLWTHLSRAVYGFIIPETSTYMTVGHSGGHVSGVCYKCIQTDGHECGGYCPPDPADLYLYYWLWDVNDLAAVRAGTVLAHEVLPYEYGEFPAAFPAVELGGGYFDPASQRLYLTLQRADREQGTYSNPPVVVAYDIDTGATTVPDLEGGTLSLEIVPNPNFGEVNVRFHIEKRAPVSVAVFDAKGRRVRSLFAGQLEAGWQSLAWDGLDAFGRRVAQGAYWIRLRSASGDAVERSIRLE